MSEPTTHHQVSSERKTTTTTTTTTLPSTTTPNDLKWNKIEQQGNVPGDRYGHLFDSIQPYQVGLWGGKKDDPSFYQCMFKFQTASSSSSSSNTAVGDSNTCLDNNHNQITSAIWNKFKVFGEIHPTTKY